MNYKSMLSNLKEIILNNKNKNWIIIGDNSSGKSELLKNIIEEIKEQVYFIDSVNRYFDINIIYLSKDERPYNISSLDIVNTRILDRYHNLKDSFGQSEHIERFYPLYEEELKKLVKGFLKIDLEIVREEFNKAFGSSEPKVKINGREIELSSGYQAVVRMFSELALYCEHLKGKGVIVIDEIDEFLSPKYSAKILAFLIETFPENNFIISTHSSNLIANSSDCNIIALGKDDFRILDSNDFTTLTDVNTLFNKLFSIEITHEEDEIESRLQRFLDLKIMNNWSEREDEEFEKIIFDNLTPVQKIIYKQIQEW